MNTRLERRDRHGAMIIATLCGFLIAVGVVQCGDASEREFDSDRVILNALSRALGERRLDKRIQALSDLERQLRPLVASSRVMRNAMLQTCNTLASAFRLAGAPAKAAMWDGLVDERANNYISMDPTDGRARAFLVQRLAARGAKDAAWKLLEGASATVDLDTASMLVAAAASVDARRHLEGDPGRLGTRRLLALYEGLVIRVRDIPERLQLLEQLLCDRGLVELSLGQVADARNTLDELRAVGPVGAQYFRLQTSLAGLPDKKR